MKYLKTLAIATLGLFAFTACDNEKEAEVEVGDTEISMEMEREMNDFETTMKNWGERIDNEIAELDAEIEEAQGEAKEELEETRAEWREWRADLDARMKRFNQNAKDNWAEFKSDTQRFFENMEREIENEDID
ncbi:hypothetical protein [Portibacter marinus]|uniref:hypothetical protein n=1 Tax=Portibacter marinus TaxID=2898660 RepID=UPI001F4339F9|nr:hypothetical protein [Portibacter marinus]